MVEFYGAIQFGPAEQGEAEEYMIIVHDDGREEKIPPERFWEFSIDAMHYQAPRELDEEGEQ